MNHYVDKDALQEFTTKLHNKQKTIFASKTDVGTPLLAATASAMTDTTKIYVYTGSETGYTAGNWYFYDGSAWTSGGVYNSAGIDTDKTLSVSDMAADAAVVGNELTDLKADLSTKAEYDGSYDSMTVGNAEQLNSSQFVEDKVPYLFRTSGGSTDIGDRAYRTIVGGTVGWNQLVTADDGSDVSYGVTFTINNGVITANGTSTGFAFTTAIVSPQFINGHVLLLRGGPAGGSDDTYFLDTGVDIGRDKGSGLLSKYTGETKTAYIRPIIKTGVTANNLVFKPQLFDLTAMFGTTIADYIYSLEQATAGAGVAWFRKLFPRDYYPYNAGELKSVEGLQSHESVGFNQWDEEWELGYINASTGQNASSNNCIRSKNYIPALGGTVYYAKSPSNLNAKFYDGDKGFISGVTVYANTTFTTPANARYIRFFMPDAYGTTYNHDICINLSWSGYRNGEYEPYSHHSYPLDDTLTLRGIPKLDSSNNLYYDGDTYESDGTVTRRYGIVDLGTLTWGYQNGSTRFYSQTIVNLVKAGTTSITVPIYTVGDTANVDMTIQIGDNSFVYVKNTSYTDATTFKTAMSGVMLIYELATPTTETAEPFQSPQIVDDFGTEEYVTDSIVPVGHVTQYPANLRDKLQHLPSPTGTAGIYAVSENDKEQLSLVTLPADIAELPDAPTSDGSYVLKCTVASGQATYTWEVDA